MDNDTYSMGKGFSVPAVVTGKPIGWAARAEKMQQAGSSIYTAFYTESIKD